MSTASPSDEAKRWLRLAKDDLGTAELAAQSTLIAPHIGCYHAQQSVEKALKSILILLQIRFPFHHDLDELRDLIPNGWEVRLKHPSLGALTQWISQSRYPGNWPEATDQDARDAFREARAVWETVLDDLERHGLDISRFR